MEGFDHITTPTEIARQITSNHEAIVGRMRSESDVLRNTIGQLTDHLEAYQANAKWVKGQLETLSELSFQEETWRSVLSSLIAALDPECNPKIGGPRGGS